MEVYVKNPAGAECAFYYEDFARGAALQECRAARQAGSAEWRPDVCAACAVPGILKANGSARLVIRISIGRTLIRRRPRVRVIASCAVHGGPLADPYTGCQACNAEADDLLRRAFD
jgi:hypothetical protein